MKKVYLTPECGTVHVETMSFLAFSGNSYGEDQGRIQMVNDSSEGLDASLGE